MEACANPFYLTSVSTGGLYIPESSKGLRPGGWNLTPKRRVWVYTFALLVVFASFPTSLHRGCSHRMGWWSYGILTLDILLMEEVLYHLECRKPCNWWDKPQVHTSTYQVLQYFFQQQCQILMTFSSCGAYSGVCLWCWFGNLKSKTSWGSLGFAAFWLTGTFLLHTF